MFCPSYRTTEEIVAALIFLPTTCWLQFVTSDCFSNEGQYQAGFALTLTLVKGSVPTVLDPATAPEPQVTVAAV